MSEQMIEVAVVFKSYKFASHKEAFDWINEHFNNTSKVDIDIDPVLNHGWDVDVFEDKFANIVLRPRKVIKSMPDYDMEDPVTVSQSDLSKYANELFKYFGISVMAIYHAKVAILNYYNGACSGICEFENI